MRIQGPTVEPPGLQVERFRPLEDRPFHLQRDGAGASDIREILLDCLTLGMDRDSGLPHGIGAGPRASVCTFWCIAWVTER